MSDLQARFTPGPENPPAFPIDPRDGLFRPDNPHHWHGMTLRDWFAGQALCGILSGPASRPSVAMKEWFDAPDAAYKLADAMLAARAAISKALGETPNPVSEDTAQEGA